jgi:hypothetical protein
MSFFPLDLGKGTAPRAVKHFIHVLDDKDEAHDIVLAPFQSWTKPRSSRRH